jgi:uncharacterized cupredoxin-like copper-binding protein
LRYRTILVTLVTPLLLAACSAASSGQGSSTGSDGSMGSMPGMDGSEGYTFGEPGDPMAANRTVGIRIKDALRFQPSSVRVQVGQTIRFDVTNDGQTMHEFVLGDRPYQAEHEVGMGEMSGSPPPYEPNALVVQPGETKSLSWTFTKKGIVLYGCHVPGHYEAGMVGSISVGWKGPP